MTDWDQMRPDKTILDNVLLFVGTREDVASRILRTAVSNAFDLAADQYLRFVESQPEDARVDRYWALVAGQFGWNADRGVWLHRGASGKDMSYGSGRFTALAAELISPDRRVDDVTLSRLLDRAELPLLETAFAGWTTSAIIAGSKKYASDPRPIVAAATPVRNAAIKVMVDLHGERASSRSSDGRSGLGR